MRRGRRRRLEAVVRDEFSPMSSGKNPAGISTVPARRPEGVNTAVTVELSEQLVGAVDEVDDRGGRIQCRSAKREPLGRVEPGTMILAASHRRRGILSNGELMVRCRLRTVGMASAALAGYYYDALIRENPPIDDQCSRTGKTQPAVEARRPPAGPAMPHQALPFSSSRTTRRRVSSSGSVSRAMKLRNAALIIVW